MTDPRQNGAQPPFSTPAQQPPGLESKMSPPPDFGEESYVGSGKLEGKAALITGGDSGIGRAVAVAFAREGADVLISYLDEEEEDAKATCECIERAGRRCVAVPGDIREEAQCRKLVDRAFEAFGRLDVLVNNAAFQMTHKSLDEISAEEFDRTFRTNVYANFFLCKAAAARMKPGASIISTAFVNADKPNATLVAYAATKGAIQNMSGGMAQLLAEKGIRVNCVAPGPFWTPLIPSTMPPEKVEEFGKQTPIKTPRPAGGTAGGLRAARLGPSQLHVGRDDPCDGRRAVHLSRAMRHLLQGPTPLALAPAMAVCVGTSRPSNAQAPGAN
jgi:NAD(P)-dependent dehydrogenase (short-subunit alcohol dehydrogenase family)